MPRPHLDEIARDTARSWLAVAVRADEDETVGLPRDVALASWRTRPIVLVGFMGSGKTSVARLLARRLDREWADSDAVVVRELGAPIAELFASGREAEFRAHERAAIARLVAVEPPLVLALGGGAFVDPSTAQTVLERGLVVHLAITLEEVEANLDKLARGRPLLRDRPIEEIRALFRAREPVYARAHLTLETGRRGPGPAVRALLDRLEAAG